MSLPIIGGNGGGNGGSTPPPPTHTPLDPTRLMRIASDLEDRVDEEDLDTVNLEFIEEYSEETGIPENHIVAALLASTIELEHRCNTAVVVCAGKCQSWGSLDHLQRLLDMRRERAEAGDAVFDVRVRSCLDRCEHPPMLAIETPDGTAALPKATAEAIDEALEQLVND